MVRQSCGPEDRTYFTAEVELLHVSLRNDVKECPRDARSDRTFAMAAFLSDKCKAESLPHHSCVRTAH